MKAVSDKRMRDTPHNGISTQKVVNASASARPTADFAEIVGKTVKTLLGREVPDDAPLMGAGLDSIAAVELISTLSQSLNIEIEPTALFDYPTIASLAKYFAGMDLPETVVLPSLPQASMKPRAQVDVAEVVAKAVEELLGTIVPDDAPLMGAGLDSIAAVELVETLSQNLSTEIEPTALFDHPTIGSLVRYFAAEMEPSSMTSALDSSDILQASSEYDAGNDNMVQQCYLAATAMYLPTVERSFTNGDLEGLSHGRYETATHVPITRWNMDAIDTRRFSADARSRARYGSFLQSDFSMFDNTMFRISPAEARPLEPQQRMLLEVGYEALHRQGQNRSTLVDSDTGIFTGMMNMDAQ